MVELCMNVVSFKKKSTSRSIKKDTYYFDQKTLLHWPTDIVVKDEKGEFTHTRAELRKLLNSEFTYLDQFHSHTLNSYDPQVKRFIEHTATLEPGAKTFRTKDGMVSALSLKVIANQLYLQSHIHSTYDLMRKRGHFKAWGDLYRRNEIDYQKAAIWDQEQRNLHNALCRNIFICKDIARLFTNAMTDKSTADDRLRALLAITNTYPLTPYWNDTIITKPDSWDYDLRMPPWSQRYKKQLRQNIKIATSEISNISEADYFQIALLLAESGKTLSKPLRERMMSKLQDEKHRRELGRAFARTKKRRRETEKPKKPMIDSVEPKKE